MSSPANPTCRGVGGCVATRGLRCRCEPVSDKDGAVCGRGCVLSHRPKTPDFSLMPGEVLYMRSCTRTSSFPSPVLAEADPRRCRSPASSLSILAPEHPSPQRSRIPVQESTWEGRQESHWVVHIFQGIGKQSPWQRLLLDFANGEILQKPRRYFF